ncbi:MAG: phosphatase PAP2 family protein [Clostridia bacterium]|nr:phosphatase PAP2 family protein [Clostridia bacterium]
MADWLNTAFYAFDKSAFISANALVKSCGAVLLPIAEIFAILGKGGIFFIVLSIVLILFKRTRRAGVSMFLAIGVGALFTNVILKNAVARPRPYLNEEFKSFWQAVGASTESEYSFPSGHTTVTMTSMTALFLSANKKWSWIGFVVAVIMALSRVYLIVHYLTDVIAGLIVGGISGVIGYYLSKLIFQVMEKNADKKFCAFSLNADIKNLFKKKTDDNLKD